MYGETSDKAGETSGSLNFYADLSLAVVEFAIGFLLDYFGRKTLSIVGFFVYGACMMASPYVGTIYPGVLCVMLAQKLFGLGLVMNSPFLADYVNKDSMGIVVGIYGVII